MAERRGGRPSATRDCELRYELGLALLEAVANHYVSVECAFHACSQRSAFWIINCFFVTQVHEALCKVHHDREQARQERARRRVAAAVPDAALGVRGR